jgi:hypothetical protein
MVGELVNHILDFGLYILHLRHRGIHTVNFDLHLFKRSQALQASIKSTTSYWPRWDVQVKCFELWHHSFSKQLCGCLDYEVGLQFHTIYHIKMLSITMMIVWFM